MRLVTLDEISTKEPFDCGDTDLNGFFIEDAINYQRQMIAKTYVLVEDSGKVIAYFSLLNDKISHTTIDKNLWRKVKGKFPHDKHMGSYPAVKIGRLAVSLEYRGQQLGTGLISAVKQILVNDKSVSACRFLTVDAYKEALPFYEKNGFKFLVNNIEDCEFTVPMYYDLMQLK